MNDYVLVFHFMNKNGVTWAKITYFKSAATLLTSPYVCESSYAPALLPVQGASKLSEVKVKPKKPLGTFMHKNMQAEFLDKSVAALSRYVISAQSTPILST